MTKSITSNDQPTAIKDGIQFWPIPSTTDAEIGFGLGTEAYFHRRALPKVPRKFEDIVESLFFSGGKLPEMAKGVDSNKAVRRLRALLSSFAPAHESKVATAAYALWVWSTPSIIEASHD